MNLNYVCCFFWLMIFIIVQDCGIKDGDCVVYCENVVVFGCVEKRDDDFDDVRKSWFVSFWFLVDCSFFFRGEELLEFFFDIYCGMM